MSGESSSPWKFSRFCQHYVIPSRLLLGKGKNSKCQGVGLLLAFQGNHLGLLFFFLPLENNEPCEGFSRAVFACRTVEKS